MKPCITLLSAIVITVLLAGCAPATVEPAVPPRPATQVPVEPSPRPPRPTLTAAPPPTPTSVPPTATATEAPPANVIHSIDFGSQGIAVDFAYVSAYGKQLIALLADKMVYIEDLQNGSAHRFTADEYLDTGTPIALTNAGVVVARSPGGDGNFTIWLYPDGAAGQVIAEIKDPDHYITRMAISPDGGTLAAGYNHGEIRLYRTSDGKLLRTIKAHIDNVSGLAFSPNGRYLISDSWSFDSYTYVWNVSSGGKVTTLSSQSWEQGFPSFSMNGSWAATLDIDAAGLRGMRIYGTGNWQPSSYLLANVFEGQFGCDSLTYYVPAGDRTDIYSLQTGQPAGTLNSGRVSCLYDGRAIEITISRSNVVYLSEIKP